MNYEEMWDGWKIKQEKMVPGIIAGPNRYRYYIYPPWPVLEPIAWESDLAKARATVTMMQ